MDAGSADKTIVLSKLAEAAKLVTDASRSLAHLPEDEVQELIAFLTELLFSFLAPTPEDGISNPLEYMLRYKRNLQFAPIIYSNLLHRCTFPVFGDGYTFCISPTHVQWLSDAVMYLEGYAPFSGAYRAYFPDGTTRVMVSARHIEKGERVTPDDVTFLPMEEAHLVPQAAPPHLVTDLEAPAKLLRDLLGRRETRESEYQALLARFPWILGAQYLEVISHRHLDNENIPDLTAVRVKDKAHDIFEIKPPFMVCFRKDGRFSAEFLAAWDQVIRYVDFAEREGDYLARQKGLIFENPKGYLLVGFDLSVQQIREVRRIERQHKNIQIITYDELLSYASHTVAWISTLRSARSEEE